LTNTLTKASLRELEKLSSKKISKSTFQRHRPRWEAERAKESAWKNPGEEPKAPNPEPAKDPKDGPKGDAEPFRFFGSPDEVKKPPARELTPFAKRAMAEAEEREKKTG
jgi:hypothetical protein